MADYDAIIIGAGHNGLVAANVLAKGGAKVLVLERAHFLGGMAATRELFDGYKHSVGAWAVLIWRQEMTDRLELTKWGFELMDQWTSTCTFGDAAGHPVRDVQRPRTHGPPPASRTTAPTSRPAWVACSPTSAGSHRISSTRRSARRWTSSR